MGQQGQFARRANIVNIHHDRRQNEGGIHLPFFQGRLDRVPPRHANGFQFEMLGLQFALCDQVLQHPQDKMVRNLDVGHFQFHAAVDDVTWPYACARRVFLCAHQSEGLVDFAFQLRFVEGFGHKGVDPGIDGLFLLGFVALAGGHQKRDSRRGRIAFDPTEQLVTVLVGHVPVTDDQINLGIFLKNGDGLVAVHRFGNAVKPQGLKGLDSNFPHDRGVFNQQNLDIFRIESHSYSSSGVVSIQAISQTIQTKGGTGVPGGYLTDVFNRAHCSENDLERHRLIIGFSGGNFNGKYHIQGPRTRAVDHAGNGAGHRGAAACPAGIDRASVNRRNLYDIFTDLPEIVVILKR